MASNGDNTYVKTLRLSVDPAHIETDEAQAAIAQAAQILRSGGLVALPTETVYGLGANALDPAAVARIFAAKQRPSWDPVIVHVAGPLLNNPMLEPLLAKCPSVVYGLMEAFWPGPLTLLLPRSAAVPDIVTAGRPLVGIRMPAHRVAFEVIRQAGVPVAAPSANVFSHISPTTAAHVLEDLDGKIDIIIDAGPTQHGVESTVLDPTQSPMMIYRPGAVTAQQIREVAGPVVYFEEKMKPLAAAPEALPSPGVGLRHYAPRARLVLCGRHARRTSHAPGGSGSSAHGRSPGSDASCGAGTHPIRAAAASGRVCLGSLECARRISRKTLFRPEGARCGGMYCDFVSGPTRRRIVVAIRDRLRKAARSAEG